MSEVDDFLARERAILGNDASLFTTDNDGGSAPTGDMFAGATDFPDLGDDLSGPPPSLPAPAQASLLTAGFPSIDSLTPAQTSAPPPVTVTGDEELDAFESEFPDISETVLPPSQVSYGTSPYAPTPTHPPGTQSRTITTFPVVEEKEEDSEVILAWKETQKARIAERDEKSKKKKEETQLAAEKQIDDFYDSYNQSKEKSIKENKEQEADFLKRLQESLSEGTTWERICATIELENSQSKTVARSTPGGSDLQRMKEILLKLKRQGESAPGAKGY